MFPNSFNSVTAPGPRTHIQDQKVVLNNWAVFQVDSVLVSFHSHHTLLDVLSSAPLSQRLKLDLDLLTRVQF